MTKITVRSAASISTAPAREVIARGVRNTVGFDWNPVNKQLYFSDNGRDWMSEDVPEDELNRVTKPAPAFRRALLLPGQPAGSGIRLGPQVQRVHAADRLDRPALGGLGPALQHRRACSRRSTRTPSSSPATARGTGRTSSAATSSCIFLNKDGTVKSMEPFITGFLVDNKYIGRPVDVEFMKDGSMLLSDDWNGAIYRITYGKARTASR